MSENAASTRSPAESFAWDPPKPGRRRRFSEQEKRALLAEALRPGETISSVGRRFNVPIALLFRWRRQLGMRVHDEPPATAEGPQKPAKRTLSAEIAELRTDIRALRDELEALRTGAFRERSRQSH